MRDEEIVFDEDSPRTRAEDWEGAKTTLHSRVIGRIGSNEMEVGLIELLIFSVGATHGRERLRAMGGARDRGHGPLLQFNQLNPHPLRQQFNLESNI